MRVLVACEESQRVCTAFRERGHEAYSCDLLEPSGGHPEWHILGDVLPLLDGDCSFQTMDGTQHAVRGGVGYGDSASALHLSDRKRKSLV